MFCHINIKLYLKKEGNETVTICNRLKMRAIND